MQLQHQPRLARIPIVEASPASKAEPPVPPRDEAGQEQLLAVFKSSHVSALGFLGRNLLACSIAVKKPARRLIGVTLDQRVIDVLTATRTRTGLSLSELARRALRVWLEHEGGRLPKAESPKKQHQPRRQRAKRKPR